MGEYETSESYRTILGFREVVREIGLSCNLSSRPEDWQGKMAMGKGGEGVKDE